MLGYLAAAILVAGGVWWAVDWFSTPRVVVTRAATGPVVEAFYATGTVRPVREFPVRAPSGGTLEKVLVDKGDRVKAGQEVAVVVDPVLQYALDRAQAELSEKRKRAEAKQSPVLGEFDARIGAMGEMVATARREVDRMEAMTLTQAASIVDRDRAADLWQTRISEQASLVAQRQAKQYELQREAEVAQAEYDAALWNLQQQTLKAPVDGAVLDRPISRGTRVAVNDAVMRIADVRPSELVMRAAVDEEDVTKVRVGQTVRMSLYSFPGQPISGKVRQIYDEADASRRTFEIDVAFDRAEEKLAPGMTGELAFVIDEKPSALIVPSTALQAGKVHVVRDGKLAAADVRVGLRSFDRVEITSGITADDAVVVTPLGGLPAGRRVRTTVADIETLIAAESTAQGRGEGGVFKGMR
ncbi:MAG TPA: efflux RND transporter periplasmic adaptor subunit [Tepidisphaeraceae bacterium]|jgi:RND family efflux transporter MFP subunit